MTTDCTLHLTPENSTALISLCGPQDAHLRYLEKRCAVTIYNRGHHFYITGYETDVSKTKTVLKKLYDVISHQKSHPTVTLHQLKQFLDQPLSTPTMANTINPATETPVLQTPHKWIKPHNTHQSAYLTRIEQFDINFAIGPAGTGKTYLAVACAVAALEKQQISRIILVRPAVEAGEKLGFLPGDFAQKLDPYFRPLYDALYDMLGLKQTMRLIEKQVIEIAPLAYMRGRTLNHAFVILDEAQNTTPEQMKMFLTRIGVDSKMVISGDISQTDLPKHTLSGLRHSANLLSHIDKIGFTYFDTHDIIRHSLVQTILQAYEAHD